MANNIGDLNVSLTADVTKYKQSLSEASKLTNSFSNNLKGSLGDATAAVKGFVGAWAGMQAVNGIMAKFNEIGNLADTAAGLNVSTEALQKLEYAGISAGVSVDQFHALLQRSAKASAEFAEGNENAIDTFKKLGIASVNLNAPDEVLMDIIEHLNKIPNAAQRMQVAIELGGKGGAQSLLRLAATGRDELGRMMDEMTKKNLVMTDEMIKGADDAGDAIATLAKEFDQKLKISIASNKETISDLGNAFFTILPAVLTLVSNLASGFVWLGKNIGETVAKFQGFETGEQKVKRLTSSIATLANEEAELVKKYNSYTVPANGAETWKKLQINRQQQAAAERELTPLWSAYTSPNPDKNEDYSGKKKPNKDKPTLAGAGAPKGGKTAGSSKSVTTEEDRLAQDVAALLQKSDTLRLNSLSLQTAELQKQKTLWEDIDTAGLSDDQKSQRVEALQMYSEALAEVAVQTESIYEARAKDFADSTKEWATWAEQQRATAQAIAETVDPTIRLKREIAEVKALTENGFLPVEQAEAYIKTIQDRTKETTDYVKDLGMTFQSAFQSAILEGKGFRDVLAGVIKDIAAMILKMGVVNPMMEMMFGNKAGGGASSSGVGAVASSGILGAAFKGIMGMFGGGGGATGLASLGSSVNVAFAKGGVFNGPVKPFASGGVFNGPTLFPMDGGTGLAGEAGPEAILPLKRIGGRLGVSANLSGGGNTVVNNVNINVEGGNNADETGRIVAEKVMRAIANQEITAARRVGGSLNPMSIGA